MKHNNVISLDRVANLQQLIHQIVLLDSIDLYLQELNQLKPVVIWNYSYLCYP
jgi:hypothetical protein